VLYGSAVCNEKVIVLIFSTRRSELQTALVQLLYAGCRKLCTEDSIISISHVFVDEAFDSRCFSIQVSYKNSTEGDPHLLTLPNCEEGCPLERFIKMTKSIIPEDHDNECKKEPTEDQPDLHIPPNSLPPDWEECLKRT
ncbi:unnamed protein product, partial [Timema podura]|nr:unnamed protein product [Timema podura]